MRPIPIVAVYRNCGLHNFQDEQRLAIVRAEIDKVLDMAEIPALFKHALDRSKAPESRLLAAEKIHSLWTDAAQAKTRRSGIDLQVLDAHVAGLDSDRWRSPWVFGVLPDSVERGAVERPVPLREDR